MLLFPVFLVDSSQSGSGNAATPEGDYSVNIGACSGEGGDPHSSAFKGTALMGLGLSTPTVFPLASSTAPSLSKPHKFWDQKDEVRGSPELSLATAIDSEPLAVSSPGLPPSGEPLETAGLQDPLCFCDGVNWGLLHLDTPVCLTQEQPVWIQRPGRATLDAASTFLVPWWTVKLVKHEIVDTSAV